MQVQKPISKNYSESGPNHKMLNLSRLYEIIFLKEDSFNIFPKSVDIHSETVHKGKVSYSAHMAAVKTMQTPIFHPVV